jgi:apolipoprotein N-acyltransferase
VKRTLMGLGITALIWVPLIGAYAVIEWLRGNVPFAGMEWDVGGMFVTFTILLVLALGAAIGYASDRIQRKMGR